MSKSIVLYADGSGAIASGKKQWLNGFGIVALFDDCEEEHSGGYASDRRLCGAHELIAFVETMKFALSKGFRFEEMTFYIDDEILGVASFWLHPGNYAGTLALEKFQQRMRVVTDLLYDDKTYEQVFQCLQLARIVKLKGHRFSVYQNRADYLARISMRSLESEVRTMVMAFAAWLEQGLTYYDQDQEAKTWYPPFVAAAA